jgi:hypothetical protein
MNVASREMWAQYAHCSPLLSSGFCPSDIAVLTFLERHSNFALAMICAYLPVGALHQLEGGSSAEQLL